MSFLIKIRKQSLFFTFEDNEQKIFALIYAEFSAVSGLQNAIADILWKF